MSQPSREWKIGELTTWVNNVEHLYKAYHYAELEAIDRLNNGESEESVQEWLADAIRPVVDDAANMLDCYTADSVRAEAAVELADDTFANIESGYFDYLKEDAS